MTWLDFLQDHYQQRLSESKSYKEKQFLSQTLKELSNDDPNRNQALYRLLPIVCRNVYQS